MKLEVSDSSVLQMSAGLTGAYGAHFFFAPKAAQEFHVSPKAPMNNTMARWFGLAMLQNTAAVLAASRADAAPHKDMLKTAGACWATAAANTAWNAHKKHQKEDWAWPNAALQAGVAGVLLWRGCRKGHDKGTHLEAAA